MPPGCFVSTTPYRDSGSNSRTYSTRSAWRDLGPKLDGPYQIADWTQSHSNFFKAIQTENGDVHHPSAHRRGRCLNIVSTLVMVVTDKRADIAILRTQGMTPGRDGDIHSTRHDHRHVRYIVGRRRRGFAGVERGNHRTGIERLFGIQFLSADVYYISELPSKLLWSDVYRITGMAFLLSALATIYPAWQASRIKPAEELRYE